MISPANITEVTRLTRLGKLDEAMAILRGEEPTNMSGTVEASTFIDMVKGEGVGGTWSASFETQMKPDNSTVAPKKVKPRFDLADLVKRHTTMKGAAAFHGPNLEPIPEGARFDTHSFANAAGGRSYRLYVPSTLPATACPLIVMLHGCTQSPEDFAAGTRMNALAETHRFLVAYPGQTQAANASKCWNWFNTDDQTRDRGEPSIIAGITRQIMAEFSVDPAKVFVAGLSAGGAAAAIMGATYPELYAAIGVHSGLPAGAAHDMSSAFAAMSQGIDAPKCLGSPVRTIVFHGDADTTVHPKNGNQVIAQARRSSRTQQTSTTGKSAGGMSYSRITNKDAAGRNITEEWTLHGAGHAWSGGSSAGSYTDPRGPDASAEMIRFFLENGEEA